MAAAADNGLQGMQAILLIGKAQQRPGVPLGKVMRAQQARAVRRQAQQTQLVGNGGLRFPQLFRRLLLRKAVGRDQPRDGRSLLQVVQIAALEVFDQREQRALLLA